MKSSGSAFQVELAAQPVHGRFDHLRTPCVLWCVCHDRDPPAVFAGHDRNGEIRRQLADISISSLIAASSSSRFCRFLQPDAFAAERGHRLWLSARAHVYDSRVSLWLSATGEALKRRAIVQRDKDIVALMFPPHAYSRLASRSYVAAGPPAFRSCETAVTSCAGANGFATGCCWERHATSIGRCLLRSCRRPGIPRPLP